MLNEELKDQILNTKINYFNGYLASLALLNSYSIVGMKCKLYAFNFSAGDIEKCIQNNVYELFGVYPNDWNIEIEQINDWENRLKSELNASLKRRIPRESDKSIAQQLDYTENSLVKDLGLRTKLVNENFISMFKNEFITDSMCVYELKITEKSSSYRLIGIDLIFEIDSTKILFLQILGSD
ncbi:hypothetical protein C8C83_4684 [Flavobacterium sp. 90]|uniref:hypothetical protein n=1 Tax=unclassified Flavobacterium TaxID=196869 RepID=UPI000EAE6048|nr:MULTISPECIES: hypothetical protein [unclassified Flavobacterium]RKR05340.1 hypothetical protein C8C82_5027 [Flavobacterium sp. 81]TCK56654.1 hypothetical protein C8C83_4684 [Flavobacterium sp. 90]